MSVYVYRLKYEQTGMGRVEAQWLCNHSLHSNDAQDVVSIDRAELDDMVKRGKSCAGDCQFFDKDESLGMGPKAHAEVGRTIKAKLLRLLKEAGEDIIDLSISW